jgi:hypothetical protein
MVAAEPREGSLDTHRRGSTTKPLISSVRLAISSRSPGDLATASLLGGRWSRRRPNEFQPRKALVDLVENPRRAVTILYAGRVDNHAQRQAFDVAEGVHLAALHLLAGVFNPSRSALASRHRGIALA